MPGPYGGCFRPLDAMWYTGYITVKRYTMPKQTLQQKIRRALGRFTAKRIAMILLGTAILLALEGLKKATKRREQANGALQKGESLS